MRLNEATEMLWKNIRKNLNNQVLGYFRKIYLCTGERAPAGVQGRPEGQGEARADSPPCFSQPEPKPRVGCSVTEPPAPIII